MPYNSIISILTSFGCLTAVHSQEKKKNKRTFRGVKASFFVLRVVFTGAASDWEFPDYGA